MSPAFWKFATGALLVYALISGVFILIDGQNIADLRQRVETLEQ